MRVSQTPFRVVIAEDEALIRLDLKEMLEEDGYVVAGEASDGEAAVKLTESLRPDLVIMDIKMPGLDGISAAERITADHLAPVVILTAFSQRDLVLRARDAGAMAFLVKPFTKADLVPGDRDRGEPVPGVRGARVRGHEPQGPAGGAQAARPRQGAAPGRAGVHRGRGVPLDPEELDGPPHDHAGRGRGGTAGRRAGRGQAGGRPGSRCRPGRRTGAPARRPGTGTTGASGQGTGTTGASGQDAGTGAGGQGTGTGPGDGQAAKADGSS